MADETIIAGPYSMTKVILGDQSLIEYLDPALVATTPDIIDGLMLVMNRFNLNLCETSLCLIVNNIFKLKWRKGWMQNDSYTFLHKITMVCWKKNKDREPQLWKVPPTTWNSHCLDLHSDCLCFPNPSSKIPVQKRLTVVWQQTISISNNTMDSVDFSPALIDVIGIEDFTMRRDFGRERGSFVIDCLHI